jgi:hypothetical protein
MVTAIPVVDPVDLERMWAISRNNLGKSIGLAVYQKICKPGADFQANAHRITFLHMLACASNEVRNRLIPWLKPDLVWSESAFRAAAKLEIDYGFSPFLIEEKQLNEFIELIKKESYE